MSSTRRVALPVVLALVAAGAFALLWSQGRFAADEQAPSSAAGTPVPEVEKSPAARIAIAGDTGTGGAAERATAQQMVVEARDSAPYDALLLLGDLVYEVGDPARVDDVVTDPFAGLLEHGTELIAALGNHDYVSGEQQQILSALGRERSWYVERVGPVRVVVLDSERVEDPQQTEWLRRTLAAPHSTGTWTIVAMHHPAYSAGEHGSSLEVREAWAPLFDEYDVPLVLAGHDHDYQRSTPIDGVTYVVSGAGAKLRPTGTEDFTAVSSSTLHYLDLLAYQDRLLGRAIDQQGKLVDEFTITR